MNLVRNISPIPVTGLQVVESLDDLSQIHRPSNAGVLCPRDSGLHWLDWLNRLDPVQLPALREVIRPSDVARRVTSAADGVRMPNVAERDLFIADVVHLTEVVQRVCPSRHIRLRLDVVTSNACRKFHMDAIKTRLICTYRGTGTQYGTARAGLDPIAIHTVATGVPIVLRGTLCPEAPVSGLRHRSPPIEGTGETRLVLVIDPVANADL